MGSTRRAMRLIFAAAPLVALFLLAPAAAAASPARIGVARIADERPAHAVTEQWRLRVDDPRSPRALELRMTRFQIEVRRFDLDYRRSREAKLDVRPQPYRRGRLRFAGPEGEVTLRHGRTVIDVRLRHRYATGHIRLRRIARGPRLKQWSFAPGPSHGRGTLSAAMPVATSAASGRVRFVGGLEKVDRWRGSYMHLWGSLDLEWSSWDHGQIYVSHEPRGTATVLMGFAEQFRPVPQRRDAHWRAVLARTTPAGTRVCRPRVRRSRWRESVQYSGFAQQALTGGCRGVGASRFVVPDRWYLGLRGFTDGYEEGDGFLRGSRHGHGWTLQFVQS